jgi:RNA polymerase sigma-70 factor (ECF subfamily)
VADRQPVRGPLAGFDLAAVDRRFKALTALRQRKHEDIEQEDVLEIADEADTPEASLDRSNTSAILRACVAKLSPAHREIINLVYYHEKSVEEAGAIIGFPRAR